MYHLLRDDKIAEFNQRRAGGESFDLRGTDLRGLDLRTIDPQGLDLSGTYLRHADLRGLDLRETNLEGASLLEALVSGAYFPPELSPDEISLSLNHGTRLRYNV
ncbi:MAG: pentapeptide repeat-containing protein [bacterium]|nr:pentapeptide repeat-containing protein [bacterium]